MRKCMGTNACKILIGLNTKRPMSPIIMFWLEKNIVMKFSPEMSMS